MPEGEDGRAGDINADRGTGSRDVAIAKRDAEYADNKRGERWDDCELDSLLARENVHEDEFSRATAVGRSGNDVVEVFGEAEAQCHERQRGQLR